MSVNSEHEVSIGLQELNYIILEVPYGTTLEVKGFPTDVLANSRTAKITILPGLFKEFVVERQPLREEPEEKVVVS